MSFPSLSRFKMCLIFPVGPSKKPSKKSASKSDTSGSVSKSQPSARITNNATTSHSHTVELPTSHLPPYIVQKAPSETSAIQTTPSSGNTPSPFQYLDQPGLYTATSVTVPVRSAPASASSNDRKYRDCVLDDIDFVQTLSDKLSPAPSSPKAPSEAEKKMQAEVKRIGDLLKQRERDDEIAVAVAKGKAEGKAEMAKNDKAAEAPKTKEQKSSCNAESCACSENSSSRKAGTHDGFILHLNTHQNRAPLSGGYMCNEGPGYVDASGAGLCETQRSSLGDAAMGNTRRVMDRMRHVEARTTLLETEMEMGWERDAARERRRIWEMERERYRYPNTWGRGYL
jgi:hypothetical protein